MLSFGSRGRGLRATLAIASFAIILAACGGMASAPVGDPAGPGGGQGAGPLPEQPTGGEDGDGSGNGTDGRGLLYQDLTRPDLMIIKTGSIAIQVTGIDAAVNAATGAMVALGGYASASERSGEDDDAQASVTYRVPSARWEEALAAVRGLGEKVLAERSGTEDVTAQVVDLGARIKNLQATEAAFQEIMTRATRIEDVLKVQAELSRVRGEIEQLSAQKASLEERAALSTLTVVFALKPNPILTTQEGFDPATEVDQATASLVSILQAIATAGIWFGIVWLPILVVVAIIGVVGFAVVRRIRRAQEAVVASPGGSI